MPFEFLDDAVTSDVTFHAWGASLEEVFAAAADATLHAMVRALDAVRPIETARVSVASDALDLLLKRFLDDLIYRKDTDGLLLRATEVRVENAGGRHRAVVDLAGERIDPRRHDLVADVKAVTLHDLRVERTGTGWDAHVTLDV